MAVGFGLVRLACVWMHKFSFIKTLQQPQNSPTRNFLRFPTISLSPLFFQLLETTPRVMTKTIQHLKSSLGFQKPIILLIKLGLVKLLKAL